MQHTHHHWTVSKRVRTPSIPVRHLICIKFSLHSLHVQILRNLPSKMQIDPAEWESPMHTIKAVVSSGSWPLLLVALCQSISSHQRSPTEESSGSLGSRSSQSFSRSLADAINVRPRGPWRRGEKNGTPFADPCWGFYLYSTKGANLSPLWRCLFPFLQELAFPDF